jgi:Ni,Fe-hydrogenase III component G
MKAVLISLEGTLADVRHRQPRAGTPEYDKREEILKDAAAPDSVRCLRELAHRYKLIYLGARPAVAQAATEEWLRAKGYPDGPVYLAATPEERSALAKELKAKFDFAAGIGTGWDDNELHLELGCLSVLLKEFEGHWDTVRKHLLGREHTALQTAANLLAAWAKDTTLPEPNRMDVALEAQDLLPAVEALHKMRWGYLAAITGMDHPGADAAPGWIEGLYHFCSGAVVVTLRVRASRESPCLPSIGGLIPAADFFERELSEMLGVTVVGKPDSARLFLSDDWPAGVYPLRKDFSKN